MKLLGVCCLLLLAGLCSAADEVMEEEEERDHTPSHTACQKVCHPAMGDCVDQGNGYYACMPKTPAAKKGKATKQMKTTKEKPKNEEEELMEEMMEALESEERGLLNRRYATWPYTSYAGTWPYRTHLNWPYRTHLNWPYHTARYISSRPAYGVRSTLIRPTYGVRPIYGIRPFHVIRATY